MNLSFSTVFPEGKGSLSGNRTYFIEKIWASMPEKELIDFFKLKHGLDFKNTKNISTLIEVKAKYNIAWNQYYYHLGNSGKIHTIREDSKNRWKEENDIHFSINVKTMEQFQFAPSIKVKSVQKIEIRYSGFGLIEVIINGKGLDYKEKAKLALNDGFDSVEDFFEWFNEPFKGKIIQWTDLKY